MTNYVRKAFLGLYSTPFFVAGFLWFIATDVFKTGKFVAEQMVDRDMQDRIK